MPWRGPQYEGDFPSLGWALLDWWSTFLRNPRDEREPLVFVDDQALTLVEWYRIDPVTGRFVYLRGASRRSKGRGKSPVEGAKAIAELAGEVVFDGWDADGNPVGKPWGTGGLPPPWVQVAALSEAQAENTYAAIHQFLMANGGQAAADLRIDVGLTRCFLRDRPGKLEPVTASAGTREGQPITYAVLDETHLWTPQNGGKALARTLRRNVAKMDGRSYETTNSFRPGEDSVAEGTHRSVTVLGSPGIFYDAVEAPPVKQTDSDEVLKEALRVAYGDAWWVDLDRQIALIRDPETPWEDSLRFNFNQNVDDRRKAVQSARWGNRKRAVFVPPGTRIGLGFDGSLSDDCTALIGACLLPDGEPHLFEIEVWQRPKKAPKNWRVPRKDIRERVMETFAFYDVGLMLCDPAKWQTEIEYWAEELGEDIVLFFDTNQPVRMWKACDRFAVAVDEGPLSHDGAKIMSEHVQAMYRRTVKIRVDDETDNRTKYVFVKGPEKLKIDAGIGAVLALEALFTMPPLEIKRPPAAPLTAPAEAGHLETRALATAGF